MWIYWLVFLSLIFYFYKSEFDLINLRKKNQVINIFFSCFFLLYALRSYCVGTDTIGYIYTMFPVIQKMTYAQILITQKDPIFYFIIKFIRTNISTLNIVLFTLIAISFWTPVVSTIKKYSPSIFLSLIIMMLFRYSDFPLNAMRNGIAVGIVFFSIKYVIDGKFLKFICILFFAALFHKTALFFLLIYPFRWINLIDYKKIYLFSFLILIVFLRKILYQHIFMYAITVDEKYAIYTMIDPSISKIKTYLIVAFFFIVSSFYLPKVKDKEQNKELNIFYSSIFLSIIFSTMALENAAFDRISLYFGFSFIILVPIIYNEVIRKFKKTNVFTTMMICFLSIYILGGPAPGVVPYSFFWNPKKNSTHLMKVARHNKDIKYLYRNENPPVKP